MDFIERHHYQSQLTSGLDYTVHPTWHTQQNNVRGFAWTLLRDITTKVS